jgi:capsule polysaccharide export protein KpsE/RkpR
MSDAQRLAEQAVQIVQLEGTIERLRAMRGDPHPELNHLRARIAAIKVERDDWKRRYEAEAESHRLTMEGIPAW